MYSKKEIEEIERVCYPTEYHLNDPYRRFALYFLPVILKLPLHPTLVNVIRFFVILFGISLFTLPFPYPLLGSIIFHLGIILDTFDGSIARWKKISSKRGELYDFFIDHFAATVAYPLSAGIFLWVVGSDLIFAVVLTIVSVLLAQVVFVLRASLRFRNVNVDDYREKSLLFAHSVSDSGRPIAVVLSFCALFGLFTPFLIFYSLFMIFKIMYLSWFHWRIL